MKKAFIIFYIAGAVVTFGRAWKDISPRYMDNAPDGAVFITAIGSAGWPLYWSVKFWGGVSL